MISQTLSQVPVRDKSGQSAGNIAASGRTWSNFEGLDHESLAPAPKPQTCEIVYSLTACDILDRTVSLKSKHTRRTAPH